MGDQAVFLWMLASGGFGAALGGGFGATVGAITWRSGRAAGTFLGFGMARAYERAARRELTVGTKGAVIGGTDGAAFLGAVGVVVGAVVASHTAAAGELLGPAAAAALLLVASGTFFGLLAVMLVHAGARAVVLLFVGAMLGGAAGLLLGNVYGLFAGLVVGLTGGTLLAFLGRPRGP